MILEVRLFAAFRDGRFRKKKLELPDESSVADLLGHLKISRDEPGILLVNGTVADAEKQLSAGDVVSVFPLVAGG